MSANKYMAKKLLPIGTVVVLKESDGRVMISGYLPITQNRPDHVWDYSGFRFPLGYVNDSEVFCFDEEQIDTIIQYGFRDYEADAFLEKVESSIDEIKSRIAEGK